MMLSASYAMSLRRIRIAAAWLVMGLFLWMFIGAESLPRAISETALRFQYVPSLVKFLLAGGGITSLGFLAVLAGTLLFGRVYCASLCPLGVLQDVLNVFFGRRRKYTSSRSYQTPHPLVRYGILGVTLVSSILGSLAVLNILDPYSIFGRIATHVFAPVYTFAQNLAASGLEQFDIYAVTHLAYHQFPVLVSAGSFAVLLLLLLMVSLRGRMYCNTVCPVGTLLGLLSHWSLFKITLNQASCVACGRCERICRGGCIDSANKTIDASRCVACFDCLSVCPQSSLEYASGMKRASQPQTPDPSRRKLLLTSGSALGALVLCSVPLRSFVKPALAGDASPAPVSLPGSSSIAQFSDKCTACHLCVGACPSQVIHPTFFAYGLQGVLQPALDYAQGFCAYECNVCGNVCPTGAIAPLPLPEKQLTQIGIATLVKELCLVHAKNQECGACAEVCPTHAVYTEEKNEILYPKMNPDFCIGCGACQFVCPQNPKAIFVEANQVHAKAKAPFSDQEDSGVDSTGSQDESNADFPF